MAHGHTRMFLKQMITKPGSTGAILPSSDELAGRMVEFARMAPDTVVVELGPGTGVFTRRIMADLLPGQKFFAIEVNPDFAKKLKAEIPGLNLHLGDAADLREFCRVEGVDRVDRVVSGLPWANFPESLQNRILDAMTEMLPPGGVFVTFAYLQGLVMPAGRKFKQNVKRRFASVEASGVVWKNVPPAIIYRCTK